MKWNDLNDKIPPRGYYVRVKSKCEKQGVARYDYGNRWTVRLCNFSGYNTKTVFTHWKPLYDKF